MTRLTFLTTATACLISVAASAGSNSPYISKVYEYRPAPGQFINEIPEYEEGDSYDTILQKVEEQLVGARMPGMISLGAWGGYVVFGFDHPVINKTGDYDFKIYGNALISDRDKQGGSSEPGIVLVSVDANGNGLPDDEWYELAGSEHSSAAVIKGYEVTYTRPDANHTPTPDANDKYVIDTTYIPWSSNNKQQPSGYLTRNTYHTQDYWPAWLTESELTFSGTRLPDNIEDISGDGSYLIQHFFEWGYADNLPNNEDKGFNIDWAIDNDGKPVHLDSIDFIKVITGVHQNCGRLGESSTEIAGAEDLHPDTPSGLNSLHSSDIIRISSHSGDYIYVRSHTDRLPYSIYNSAGSLLKKGILTEGDNRIDTSDMPAGMYIMVTSSGSLKFIL